MAAATLHPLNRRSRTPPPHPPIVATSNDGVLPVDLLYEIMLRLPTKPLCRFRAVCRSWRSLLCHPEFIAAAHNPGPLLAICVKDYPPSREASIMDMESGEVVKRVEVASNKAELCSMNHDRVVCVLDSNIKVIRLIDLDNDAICLLPRLSFCSIWCMVGRAAATGEHKVLAISWYNEPQVCQILNIGNNDHGWRDIGHPPLKVDCHAGSFALINGLVYFLSNYSQWEEPHAHKIMVFDLNCETWWPANSFRGPPKRPCVSLAELNGHLVACDIHYFPSIQMWFFVDSDRSHWSKRYTITIQYCENIFSRTTIVDFVKPLAVLDDGRIVLWMRVSSRKYLETEVLWIYDPRTKTFMDGIKLPKCSSVSVCAWSLLRPGRRSAIDMAAESLLKGRLRYRSKRR